MEKPLLDAMGNNKYQRVMLAARRARELAEGIGLTPEMEGIKITTVSCWKRNGSSSAPSSISK